MSSFPTLTQWVGRLRLSQQLYGSFAVLASLTALVCAVAALGLARVGTSNEALAGRWLPSLGQLSEARVAMLGSREVEVKHSRTGDASYYSEYEDKIREHNIEAAKNLSSYVEGAADEADKNLATALSKTWSEYTSAQQKVIDLGRAKRQQDAADISDGLASTAIDAALGALDAATKHTFDAGKGAGAHAAEIYEQTRNALIVLLGGTLVLGVVLAIVVARVVVGQLGAEPREAAAAVQAMAEGDLSRRINVRAGQEASLMGRIKAMQEGLASVVRRVRLNADSVASASHQIAGGNLDLSQRTDQQAVSLQHTASAMDQLGATVRRNSTNAEQGNQLAMNASAIALAGGTLVGQVVQTMHGINESSKKIADIIGVIDGIAFQTNILALNAAVEAARAGEQGRGFAVVAGEVRNLARRSADAAKEIKTLINASVERVEQGSALVDKSGATMKEIVAAIESVTGIMGQISTASVEQSAGVNDMGQAIAEMDQATQHNASLVQETAAAAESLKQQASELVSAVAVFKLAH